MAWRWNSLGFYYYLCKTLGMLIHLTLVGWQNDGTEFFCIYFQGEENNESVFVAATRILLTVHELILESFLRIV